MDVCGYISKVLHLKTIKMFSLFDISKADKFIQSKPTPPPLKQVFLARQTFFELTFCPPKPFCLKFSPLAQKVGHP